MASDAKRPKGKNSRRSSFESSAQTAIYRSRVTVHEFQRAGWRIASKNVEICIAVVVMALPAFAARKFGLKMPKEVAMILQECAYTSPIWYTPGS